MGSDLQRLETDSDPQSFVLIALLIRSIQLTPEQVITLLD